MVANAKKYHIIYAVQKYDMNDEWYEISFHITTGDTILKNGYVYSMEEVAPLKPPVGLDVMPKTCRSTRFLIILIHRYALSLQQIDMQNHFIPWNKLKTG